MIFGAPLEFKEALDSTKVKALLPTDLSTAELAKLEPTLREVARFSARTSNAQYLQSIQNLVDKVLTPQTVLRDGQPVTEGIDYATARLALKDKLTEIGYQPTLGERGTIKDLASDQRLNLVLKTNVEMAQGYGRWQQGQEQAVLDMWPAQELMRAEDREEWRDWPERWVAAGGTLYPGGGDYSEGRMIAPKNDPVWENISAFGLPYPPFDFNSGMDVRDVDRKEAIELGVIDEGEQIEPEQRDFSQDVEASVQALTPELQAALLEDLGEGYTFKDGVLTHAVNEVTEAQARAGNYAKGHVTIHGMDISIETPRGGVRRGKDRQGVPWSVTMPADYGYIKRTTGADGDHVDVYVGPSDVTPNVLVIDQVDPGTRKFDEHKVMIGFETPTLARAAYLRSFNDGSGDSRIGAETRTDIGTFKAWLELGDTKSPFTLSGRPEQIVNAILFANEGGVPCGDGWISPDKECQVGQGSAGEPGEKPKADADPHGVAQVEGWKAVGGQLGSNPGKTVVGPDGEKYYLKFPKGGAEHATQEVLAAKLYEAAGAPVLGYLAAFDKGTGEFGTATKWESKSAFDPSDTTEAVAAAKNFAVHAWLANWDAIGLSNDNQAWIKSTGKLATLDTGGSLEFRAQGGKKEFGTDVKEWETLRDATLNPQAAKVFAPMTDAMLKESAKALQKVTDYDISTLTHKYLPADKAVTMANTLMARRDAILDKFNLSKPVGAIQGFGDKKEAIITPAEAKAVASQAAAEKSVLGTVKPLAHVQTVDVTEWPSHNTSAHWAANKIKRMEEAVDKGSLEELEKHAYDLSKTKSANPYQKATAAAYAELHEKLSASKDTGAAQKKYLAAVETWQAGVPKPPTTESSVNGPSHNAKVNALFEAAKTGDVSKLEAVYTNAAAVQTYAKKQHAYKQTLIEHLKTAPQAPEGFQAAVVTPPSLAKKAAPAPKAKGTFTNADFMAVMAIKPPTFATSNKAHKEANETAAIAAHGLAMKNDLAGLKALPKTQSPKLESYKDSLIAKLDEIANPPPPPEPPKPIGELKGVFKELHEKFGITAKKGIYNDIGRYHLLGKTTPVPGNIGTFVQTKDFDNASAAAQKQHEKQYKSLSKEDQQLIKDYTSNSYMTYNAHMMKKEAGSHGVKIGLALEKAMMPIPEGTWLSRRYSLDADAVKKMKAAVGGVLQDPAIQSTSVNPGVWSGSVKMHIKVGPEVKGVYIGPSSYYKGEKEMIMVPNQRYIIQSVKETGGQLEVHAYALPTTHDQVSSTLSSGAKKAAAKPSKGGGASDMVSVPHPDGTMVKMTKAEAIDAGFIEE